MTDSQFETYTIELLKGIYNNIGAGLPYKVISGTVKQSYDGGSGIYSAEYNEIINETTYSVDGQSLGAGQIRLRVDGFDPLVYAIRKVQLFSGPSLDPRFTLSAYTFYEDNPWIDLYFESMDSGTQLYGGYGLGTLSSNAISFELRLYSL